MSENDLEEFTILLARAMQRDYVLFESVIEAVSYTHLTLPTKA